ncbi:JmjC domain-containing protein 4 [Bagarius yarrelli]|uniref:Jumonji domain-containing protein 4 n=1 Tax=Bagarius yarrelli TaxID=175774 RepID=A0A556V9M6_BAGYA|nr:JmjC domain-containing protein 4 [Bagarius yarrelli]
MFPDHRSYTTPIYFSSDWLNEYWDTLDVDDYRFVYMGPKGSWTPFHVDVFRSYSWSANICGRKKWLLYPPGQEEFLRDCCGNLAYDVTSPDMQDRRHFPRFGEACRPLEVIQEAGEILFVPSGWHHQVYNLGELSSVQKEIDEWRDTMESWDHHCQVMMKSCTGIDYAEFASFLKTIANHRISFLSSRDANVFSEALSALGPHHATFDLQRVAQVLESMLSNEDFKRVMASESSINIEELLQEIRDTISNHNAAY